MSVTWRPQLGLSLSVAVVAMTLAACSEGGASGDGESGQAQAQGITIALPDEPASLDPCDATYTENNRVLTGNVTEALLNRDPESGELLPHLATEWTEVDPTTWDFTLREGVSFSDGSALDAQSVADAVNRSFVPDLECGIKGFIFNDEDLSAEAIDDTTVRVVSTAPDPILPLRLSFLQIGRSAEESEQDNPIGTGPYALETWDRGQQITLKANESYWGDKPSIQDVRYVWRAESSVRASMVQTGEADLTLGLSPQDADNPLTTKFPLAETAFLRIDTFSEPGSDVRVRQAMNYAVDREGLVGSLLQGMAEPASQIIVENVAGYNPDIEVWAYDPDRASALVEEARSDGVDVDAEITLYGRQGFYANSEHVLEAVAEQMREVGLNVRVEFLDVSTWLDDVLLKPFPEDRVALTENVHGNNTGDAVFTVVTKFSSDGAESTLTDPRVDELVAAGSRATGPEREQIFQELMAYVQEDIVATVPIAHLSGAMMIVEGLDYTPNLQSNDVLLVSEMTFE